MDRLTSERIAQLCHELDAHTTVPEEEVLALRDLALQSLSQEAVRDEVLEEAAKVCERLACPDVKPPWRAAPGYEYLENAAKAIRALKREPNAAAKIGQSYEVMGIEQTSAPAAPTVTEMVKRLRAYANESGGAQVEQDLLEAAALLVRLGQGWIPVGEIPRYRDNSFGLSDIYIRDNDGKCFRLLLPSAPGASDD